MNNPIDFKSPTHKLPDILFKVKLQEVHSDFRFPATLFTLPVGTPHYRAVVNQSNGQIISIVGKNYQLISNEEAIEMGKQIFTQLYPSVKGNELIPYKVVAPNSKASAYIDLIHEKVNFNVWDQETWLPFLRTSNSYNRSVALSFEIGFVRKLCSNGVLFNKQSIKLKYLHNKGNRVDIISAANQIKSTSGLFTDQCKSLKDYPIPKELMFALVCQILNINLELPNKNQLKKKMNSLQNLIELTKILTIRYTKELGSNAYTAFNVVTDIVSHQDEYKNLTGFHFNVRSFFAKPTDWMDDFSNKAKVKSFVYEDYLKETIDSLERIRKHTELEWVVN
ncbi:MAG TPA: DUF932 domain-containing protein [Prolixibacteraceae bacterium]|nr:DUF932 domain-containing protein [Prolixibacteraceae bacterium]